MIMKRIISCLMILYVFLGFWGIPSNAEVIYDDISSSDGCRGIDAEKTYFEQLKLSENVQSAFLYEINSDSLLYAYEADLTQYPASFVKIMTALLVLENTELDRTVTVSQNALDSISSDAISAGLVAGEQITVENLLYCMMVKSANDAAAVLAEFVSGSQEAFVEKMNARATELGCTGTTYTNPHGLHHDEQVTTARDTCRILREALKSEKFRNFFGTVQYTVPATNMSPERPISTSNYLMNDADNVAIYLDHRVTGGRTGITTEGFRCIASTAKSGDMEVICIVMGCKSTLLEDSTRVEVFGGFPETIALYNQAFEGNALRQIIFRNQILRQQTVLNGDNDVFVYANEDVFTVLPSDYTLKDLSFQYTEASNSLEAPIVKGQNMGSVQVMYGGSCIAKTELFAANDVSVAAPKAGAYIKPEFKGLLWWGISILIIVVFAVFFIVGIIRRRKTNKQHRKYDRREVF